MTVRDRDMPRRRRTASRRRPIPTKAERRGGRGLLPRRRRRRPSAAAAAAADWAGLRDRVKRPNGRFEGALTYSKADDPSSGGLWTELTVSDAFANHFQSFLTELDKLSN